MQCTPLQVVGQALRLVRGTYGICVLFDDEPDLLIGARNGSPLILGIGDGEYFLASDASAIVEHTKEVLYLEDGDLVAVHRDKYDVMQLEKLQAGEYKSGTPLTPPTTTGPFTSRSPVRVGQGEGRGRVSETLKVFSM